MSTAEPMSSQDLREFYGREHIPTIPTPVVLGVLKLCDEVVALKQSLPPEQFVIEVSRQRVGEDPSIFIYHATVMAMPNNGVWTETLATVELLDAFLVAWKAALTMTGYGAVMLSWGIPSQRQEPSSKRWTIGRGMPCKVEELDANDRVIEI